MVGINDGLIRRPAFKKMVLQLEGKFISRRMRDVLKPIRLLAYFSIMFL